jgi:kelch-like protein 2/3
MFSSKMSESYRQKVELHNVPSGVLRPLLDYIYNSTIDIDNENVQDLFGSANMFELLELHDLCAQYMLQELTPANCMSVYRLAAMHCNEFLLAVTKGYLMKHFGEIAPRAN